MQHCKRRRPSGVQIMSLHPAGQPTLWSSSSKIQSITKLCQADHRVDAQIAIAIAERSTVDQALAGLASSGKLRCVARASTICPNSIPGSGCFPLTRTMSHSLSRGRRVRRCKSPAPAAHLPGLATQVPAQSNCLTDRPSRRNADAIEDVKATSPALQAMEEVLQDILKPASVATKSTVRSAVQLSCHKQRFVPGPLALQPFQ